MAVASSSGQDGVLTGGPESPPSPLRPGAPGPPCWQIQTDLASFTLNTLQTSAIKVVFLS